MTKMITSQIVVAYAQCPRKAFLLLNKRRKGAPHGYVNILERKKQQNRAQNLRNLKQRGEVLHPYSPEVLKKHHAFLVDAQLQADGYEATCGLLIKKRELSGRRRYHYEPVIFVGTHKIDKFQRLELFFSAHVLENLQKPLPDVGRIVTVDSKPHKVKLEKARQTLLPYLEPVQEWVDESSPEEPPVILNKHCPLCQYQQQCRKKAEQEDNLSLLDRVTARVMRKYEKKGIFTVRQLSYLFKPRKRKKRVKNPTITHKLELQALAIREQKIYLEEMPEIERKPVELFLDIEGVPDQGLYYLIGLMACVEEETIYHPFWADSANDEEEVWQQFVEKVEKYPDAPIYHYGSYEPKAITILARRYDTDGDSIKKRLVNVNKLIYGRVYFPGYSNRLKDLGKFVGATWTSPNASGLQSLVWRHHWDETKLAKYRELLVTYNEEDCIASKLVTDSLSEMENREKCVNVNEMDYQTPSKYGRNKYETDDFELITRYAYFDYQRERIYLRANKNLRKNYAKRQRVSQIKYRINQHIAVIPPKYCPFCENTDLRPYENQNPKLVIDLKFFNGGIKRWVTKFARKRFFCPNCNKAFIPDHVKGIGKYGRNLIVWSVNQYVAHRMSVEKIEETLAESFNLHLRNGIVYDFKAKLSKTYQATYDEIKQTILNGQLIHTDETTVSTKSVNGYVWVFTNIDSVFYIFRASRETEFLTEMLTDFKGVLISDFYPGYDSLLCVHQKCLLHLIRDLNDDLFKNPLDSEFRQLVTAFGQLLRLIVETIDKYGLKKRNLNKHQQDVEKFYKRIIYRSSRSELIQKYQKRFRKYEDSLFTFLNHDGIPWNNNNAEHAIKPFAAYRRSRNGLFSERSIQEYLILLSIQQSCRYQELSFFEFLKSGKRSLGEFACT